MPLSTIVDLLKRSVSDRSRRPFLFICFGGGDTEDSRLAETIARETEQFAMTTCVTVDQLDGLLGQTMLCYGPTIVILSPAIAQDTAQCAAFMKGLGGAWEQENFPVYCISRGEEPEVFRNIPGFAPFFENVIIRSAERDLRAILTELRENCIEGKITRRSQREIWFSGLKDWPRDLWAYTCQLLLVPLNWIDKACLYAAALLVFLWWKQWYPPQSITLAVLCVFVAGLRLYRTMPGDLWPRLQRAWKLPMQLPPQSDLGRLAEWIPTSPIALACIAVWAVADHRKNWASAIPWIVAGLICQLLIDRWILSVVRSRRAYAEAAAAALKGLGGRSSPDSRLGESDLRYVLFMNTFMIYWGLAIFVFRGLLPAYPAVVVAKHAAASGIRWIVAAAITGVLIPRVLAFGLRRYVVISNEAFGLRRTYARILGDPLRTRVSAIKYAAEGTEREKQDLESFPPDERAQVTYWRELVHMPMHFFQAHLMRPLYTPTDFAFISYAWRDDPGTEVSSQIAEACQAAGINYFLDKRNKAAGKDSFRRSLAAYIAKSTHFFMVVSPNITGGHVVIREIEMAMTRWGLEMMPTIICVVDACLAREFRADRKVPLALRFLLTFCPQMTPAEAAHPALMRYIVEVTRREGKLHDWLPVLSPATRVAQAMRLPGIAGEPLTADTEA